LQAGGNREGLNFGQIKSIRIPLPPTKAEQEAIVEVLSKADALIEILERLIAKKRLLKKGVMRKLLTGKTRLPGFDGKWETSVLSDCFELVGTRNAELNDNVVTISAQLGFIRQEEFFKKRVASKALENYYLIERDHFAYNRSYSNGYPFGAIKRLTKFDKAVVTTLYICFALKPDVEANPAFFEHYFEAGLLNAGLSAVTSEGGRAYGLLNITKADFLSRELNYPSLPEQTAIASVLSAMDAEITLLEAQAINREDQIDMRGNFIAQLVTGIISASGNIWIAPC
jgi:type I restriction enzyme, S subunit